MRDLPSAIEKLEAAGQTVINHIHEHPLLDGAVAGTALFALTVVTRGRLSRLFPKSEDLLDIEAAGRLENESLSTAAPMTKIIPSDLALGKSRLIPTPDVVADNFKASQWMPRASGTENYKPTHLDAALLDRIFSSPINETSYRWFPKL